MYFPPELTKDYVLQRVSEEEIFERYGAPITEGLFCSPLRRDRSPTCSFKRIKGRLYMKDWSGDFQGDCFDLAMRYYGLAYYDTLRQVSKDFNLIESTEQRVPVIPKIIIKEESVKKISVKRQPWTDIDRAFWKSFKIKKSTLEHFGVSSCERVWLNDQPFSLYSKNDPAYVYYFGNGIYKIYYPFRDKVRFIHNVTSILQGYRELPPTGEFLVITKSLKDVMSMYQFGISSVAPMAETIIPSKDQVLELRSRFKNIYSLLDYDSTGIHSAWLMRKLYGIKPLFFTYKLWNRKGGYCGAKDFADYVKLHGEEDMFNLINRIKSCQTNQQE